MSSPAFVWLLVGFLICRITQSSDPQLGGGRGSAQRRTHEMLVSDQDPWEENLEVGLFFDIFVSFSKLISPMSM